MDYTLGLLLSTSFICHTVSSKNTLQVIKVQIKNLYCRALVSPKRQTSKRHYKNIITIVTYLEF